MTTDEQTLFLQQAFAQAPEYVRSYISSGKYDAFTEKIKTVGSFTEDVQSIISNEVLMMLLGMSEPQELATNLVQEAGITAEEADAVVVLANTEIFTPIQNEAQKAPASIAPRPQASSAPQAPIVPVPSIATPPPVQPYVPPVPIPAPQPQALPIVPEMRTMAHDVEAMKNGVPQAKPIPAQSTPAPVPQTAPIPVQPTPPVVPPEVGMGARPVTAPTTPRVRTPDSAELTSTLKKYGIDPYREAPE